jgi:signal transduction histidine kinase
MKNNIRIPVLLDVATYISIAAMSLLGISGFSSLNLQLITLGLCLLFGILHRFYFKAEVFQRNPNLYFGIQAFILTLVLLLGSSSTDALNFLFVLLAIHTAHVLPGKNTAIWIMIYYAIVSVTVLSIRGTDGIYAVLFYGVTYILCGFFGAVLQQAEKGRDENQRLVDELKETQHKLQVLAVVEERNRLARDLHDSVKQQVFAISMQLSAARMSLSESDKAYSSVAEAERLAQQAGAELTSLINALRPPPLESKSLPAALRDYISEWAKRNNIETSIDIGDDLSLSVDEEQVFFRVIQEGLSNIARHSNAKQAVVELVQVESDILFCIADTGQGFDTNHQQMGVGLLSMQERLSQIGASFLVRSEKGHGTQITAKLRRAE